MHGKSIELLKHKGIATSLAVVCVASKSYSIIDRVANALSIDSISRAMYENARILENLIRQEKISEEKVKKDEKEFTKVKVIVEKGGAKEEYFVDGYLANNEHVRSFLEEASRDVGLARSVASYAMSMVASAVSKSSA